MGQFSVQTQALINTSNALGRSGEEFSKYARDNINKTGVAFMDWPAAAYGTMGTYNQARELVHRAVGAAEQAVYAMHSAVHQVAFHYMKAEAGSNLEAGKAGLNALPKKPAPVSPSPTQPGLMDQMESAAGALTGMAITAHLTVGLLAQATSFSGAAAVVAAVDAAVIVTNIRNPFTWFGKRGDWSEVQAAIANGSSNMANVLGEFSKHWSGDAASAFNSYAKDTFLPKMEKLGQIPPEMANLCTNIAWAEIVFFFSLIGATIPAIISAYAAAAAAPATAGASLSTQWGIVATWAGLVVGAVTAMVTMFNQIDTQGQKIQQLVSQTVGQFFEDARRLEGNTLAVDPKITNVSDKWTPDDFRVHWKPKN